MEDLQTWLKWVEQWAKGDESREVEIVKEENYERRMSAFSTVSLSSGYGTRIWNLAQYRHIYNTIPSPPPTRYPPRRI